jgi:hypothetical protein
MATTKQQRLSLLFGRTPAISTNPGAYGSTRDVYGNAQVPKPVGTTGAGTSVAKDGTTVIAGKTVKVSSGSGGTAATSGTKATTTVNTANVAKNAAALAAWNAEMAKPHGLAQGYSINPNINFNDKVKVHGGEDYMSEHTVTYDQDLSNFNSKLTQARQWIAPKKPTLLSTTTTDTGGGSGGGATQGDRQDSMSDRNSSNYSGAGIANPTNQPSGVGKTGKNNKSGGGKSLSSSGGSRGSLIGGKSSSSGGYGQSPGGDNRR